jgi:hypothetical protein
VRRSVRVLFDPICVLFRATLSSLVLSLFLPSQLCIYTFTLSRSCTFFFLNLSIPLETDQSPMYHKYVRI